MQLTAWALLGAGIPHQGISGELADREETASPDLDSSDDETEGITSRTRHGRAYNTTAPAQPVRKEKQRLMLEVSSLYLPLLPDVYFVSLADCRVQYKMPLPHKKGHILHPDSSMHTPSWHEYA